MLDDKDYKILKELIAKASSDECVVISELFKIQSQTNVRKMELKITRTINFIDGDE